ncbi:RNA polymerase III subunit Rpc25-domain-containing protein, partial [Auriculariales sp. MPI-PUGE-AT-0066]
MFQLAIIKDTIPLHPSTFATAPDIALKNELNKKYANKVLPSVGLCICVFDIIYAGEGKVRYGDGCLWHKVTLRLVVFRPFKSEVILARVHGSTSTHIRLTLGFFDDIYIPRQYLPYPSEFDPDQQKYFWVPSQAENDTLDWENLLDSPLGERQYIDPRDVVRVRVEADEFREAQPEPPKAGDTPTRERMAPYVVTCTIAEQGLGVREWWATPD